MSLDGSYDMVLLPLRREENNGLRLARRWRALQQYLPAAEEEHSSRPRHPPRRRRRRRGNHGHAGGGTLSAVAQERVDDAGTSPGDMSGIVLAPEATAGVTLQRRVSPKRTDDASTLAKDLLGGTLVPEMTVCSAPDTTSPPSNDQEVPSVFHPVPFRFSFDPPSDPAMVSAFVKAYPNLPGYHMWSTWDRLTAVSTFRPAGSEEEDNPDSGWDFSALNDPGAMRGFMSACDHCLSGCSDDGHDLDDEGYGPSRECFHVDLGDHNEGNHLGMPEVDDPPGLASRVDIPRELAVVPVPTGGQDIQLEQIREMQAQVNGEAGWLVQLRQNIEQEWAGRTLTGEACHRAQVIRRRIVDNARAALPPAVIGSGQDLAAAAMLLRAMPEPSTTEGRHIQGELKNLLEGAAVRQLRDLPPAGELTPRSITRCPPGAFGKPRSIPSARGTRRPPPENASATSTTISTIEPASTRRCAEATILGVGDAATVRRIAVLRPNHPVRESSAGPYDERRSLPVSEP
jgi:hypothetical protein